jgi:hypothetical protein
LLKGENLLRLPVFKNTDVFSLQSVDETFVLISRGEEDVG